MFWVISTYTNWFLAYQSKLKFWTKTVIHFPNLDLASSPCKNDNKEDLSYLTSVDAVHHWSCRCLRCPILLFAIPPMPMSIAFVVVQICSILWPSLFWFGDFTLFKSLYFLFCLLAYQNRLFLLLSLLLKELMYKELKKSLLFMSRNELILSSCWRVFDWMNIIFTLLSTDGGIVYEIWYDNVNVEDNIFYSHLDSHFLLMQFLR